ncbi:MAG: DUF401 family protein [Limnochordia bacterium]|jgi:integral membrane protein (TIGR00529 family)
MATIGLFIGISVMLIGVRKKVPIGLSALAAGLLVALLSGQTLQVLGRSLTDLVVGNGILLLSIALITVLGKVMQTSKAMERLASSTIRLFRKPQITVILLPTFAGFLSVPGASIFSAPMVDTTGAKLGMSQEQKAVANVYFRHLWYFFYPLYPPFLFLQQMTDIPYSAILIPGLIGAAIIFAITYWVSFRQTESVIDGQAQEGTQGAASTLLWSIFPLFLVLGLAIGFDVPFPWAVVCGIVAALLAVPGEALTGNVLLRRFQEGVLRGVDWGIVTAVAGIVFFSRTVVNSQAVAVLASSLSSGAGSIIFVSLVVPFLIGVITGNHQASIGITMPIILTVLAHLPNAYTFIALAYFASLIGYLISPAHVCLVGTTQYMGSDLQKTWQLAWIPTIIMLGLGLVFAILAL